MPFNDGSPIPNGRHWGLYTTTSKLPCAASGVATAALSLGDTAAVDGELYICTAFSSAGIATWSKSARDGGTVTTLTTSAGISITGDLTAAGGFRQTIGPFTAPGALGVTAATQTNLACRYSHVVTAIATAYVATRAGSIMGISGQLSAAITGAGTSITISAVKNGTEVALTTQFTQAGAEVAKFNTVAKDTLTFAAGDRLGISYTSTGISNTPALVAALEIEQ